MQNLNKTKYKMLSAIEISTVFEQMHMFSKNGISTWESLTIMEEHASSSTKQICSDMCDIVAGGKFLSEAIITVGCFPEYVIKMIEMGEKTGRSEEVFKALSDYYKNRDLLRQSLRSSITYPLCMAGMVLVVIFVILVQVMPVFEQVFAQLGLALNSIAAFLLSFGQVLNNSALAIGIIFAVLILGFLVFRKTQKGQNFFLELYQKSPFTRKISESENANRFAFSMSLMLAGGLDTISAVEFSHMIIEGEKPRRKIMQVRDLLIKGISLSDALITSGIFDTGYNGIITAGVRSGSSSQMLSELADKYYENTEKHTQKLLSIIEPALVAILCLMMGMVMLSVMLPLTGILSGM